MNTSYLFLAEGFEEIEALATVDILRRAGMAVETVSITSDPEVIGAHGVTVVADRVIADIDAGTAPWLILPGGLPGATNLAVCVELVEMLKSQVKAGRCVAAICASPAMVLGPIGLLKGHKATCYPGCEGACDHPDFTGQPVEVDGQIITGKGPGFTFRFALAIVEKTLGKEAAAQVAGGMLLI
ncbi:MAG: DJ-1/PfpI family protein [Muribaculaceae bacterium]|nr:DJ-1/PfpI family protein [Muribaculaceae bacterium]